MNDTELREMQERAVQIKELQQHRSWPVYEDYLRHKLAISQTRVLNGNMKSLEDYREEVGISKGLTFAIKALDGVEALVESEIARRSVEG